MSSSSSLHEQSIYSSNKKNKLKKGNMGGTVPLISIIPLGQSKHQEDIKYKVNKTSKTYSSQDKTLLDQEKAKSSNLTKSDSKELDNLNKIEVHKVQEAS